MKKICKGLVAIGLLALAGAASAAGPIAERAANQQARIAQGERSGSLTPREAARLQAREARLNRDIARARSDGVVTPGERRALTREENRNSRAIYRQKHDAQRR